MTRDEWKSHIAKRIGTLPHVVEWYIPKALDALREAEDLKAENEALRRKVAWLEFGALLQSTMTKEK